jgi:hypothetical protein
VAPQEREALVNLLVQRRNVSVQEANATIDRWQEQIARGVQQTKQAATQAASAAASGVSKGAFGSFFALLLGLIAAAVGGAAGTPGIILSRTTAGIRRAA